MENYKGFKTAMESPYAPLSESAAKALGDKAYDKRKVASQEIEKMVTEFSLKNNSVQISKLIEVLSNDFAGSRDANKRKGGLIGLAATSLGLGKDSHKHVDELVTPILNCLNDQDVRVRYFACESLYNVVKVSRSAIIPFLPDLFSALSRLVADNDHTVRDGSELLDRLLKDIVTESSQSFKMEAFIPLLKERIYVKNSFVRQYVISWISILNAVPEINMVLYLTDIIDGLFTMLEDNTQEIQRMCETTLTQFLKSIRNDSSSVRMEDTINTLITHAQSPHEQIKSIALTWIREFVQIFGSNVLPYASGIFTAILPCLEYNEESMKNIKECAVSVNKSMMKLVSSKEHKTQNIEQIDLKSIMTVLSRYLNHNSAQTKIAVLEWIYHLLINFPNEMSTHLSELGNNLLGILSDNSDDVVLKCISVLAEIVKSQHSKDFHILFVMVSWRTCLVETCRYNPRKSDSKRRVLHIPESKATEWLRILNIQNKPKKKLYICESHFAQECITGNIRFTNDAVPSLNLGISQTEKMEDSIEDMKSFSNAPEYIDELESDIPDGFKMEAFVPLLKERVYLKNSFVRQYVISCISILNAETEINVGLYFIDIIDGLFTMLEDNTQEIQRICESTLIKFLKSICNDDSSSISHMEDTMNTLIIHAQSPHQRIKFLALTWIREFVQIFGSNVLPYASGIFTAILPYLECEENSMANVKECAASINKSMMKLIASKKHKIQNIEEMKSIITILSRYLNHNSEQTKIAVLEWIYHLLIHFPNEMSIYLNELSNNLLDILSDNSDDVVLKCILILAEIIKSQHSKGKQFCFCGFTAFTTFSLKSNVQLECLDI
uniref:THAP-type domain-containing protein n=1 Tax=Glossina brevipalpis TaxID=37001 RepID=A0A1A9WPG6_9MUSC